MSEIARVWRPRRPAYYPLLVSGLGILEYLSAEDCALIADALDVSVNPNDAVDDTQQQRRRVLGEAFRRGAQL